MRTHNPYVTHAPMSTFDLSWEVTSGSRINYIISLMKLTWVERDLNDGRFKLYSDEDQTNKVLIPCDSSMKSQSEKPFFIQFTEFVEWIAQTEGGLWSFKIIPYHVSKLDLIFSFETVSDAVAFKMVWG